MLAPIITNNLPQIKDICQKHHVKELYVFGSAARNEMKEDSDVDFLYTMQDDIPEMDYADNFFNMLWTLETVLKRKVELIGEQYLRNRIFIEEVNNTKKIIYTA